MEVNLFGILHAVLMGPGEPSTQQPGVEFHCSFDIFQANSPFYPGYHQDSQNYANSTTRSKNIFYTADNLSAKHSGGELHHTAFH